MPRRTAVEFVYDLDPILRVAERFTVSIVDDVAVKLVVKYRGMSIECDSLDDARELIVDAIRSHSKAPKEPENTSIEKPNAPQVVATIDQPEPTPVATHISRMTDEIFGKSRG